MGTPARGAESRAWAVRPAPGAGASEGRAEQRFRPRSRAGAASASPVGEGPGDGWRAKERRDPAARRENGGRQ